ncbi:2-(1,2-epoxy-1,2-dihydrophenyl)acetyl-CoA isomerase [Nocardioides marinisabuli]|uniref:2-(1,2-epoxy-1,2-dihydrophenyl)acetyl-CoA isomerase n=1 Tax=Nocardioides marinisabuli TaxID=419476 RepID=A0A7Y9JQV2_9ACTN|nr:enoyl-CoA hydratase-related protein [Nocardioides marinisabuli]NYD57606.1 2-(1,2-epoxy-1,2-dihydrophenyl)acetyl-CoA isomerase [Nocardioides marinisabuli]
MSERTRVRLEEHGQVRLLVLDRVDALNAMDRAMLAELADVLAAVEADREVRALVVTGSGRAFCAGADIAEDNPLSLGVDDAWTVAAHRVVMGLHRLRVPTVAAINGLATGAGLDLALACDTRLAAAGTWVAEGYVDIGYSPDAGATYLLPRLVGPSRAAEMILTGRRVPAETAAQWGLVSEVVAPDELLERALGLAAQMAAKPPVAVELAKRLLATNTGATLEEALRNELVAGRVCGATADHAEAVRAWGERRDPVFEGR